MSEKNFRIQQTKNNAKGVIDGIVNTTSDQILLEAGHSVDAVTVYGVCGAGSDATTIAIANADQLGLSVGDHIYNITKNLSAVVESISSTEIETSVLRGSNASKVWSSADEFSSGIFEVQLQKRENQSETGTITNFENVLVYRIESNTLYTKTTFRGFGGTTAQAFAPGDFLELTVSENLINELASMLGSLEVKKADKDSVILKEGDQTKNGTLTFTELPKSSANPTDPEHFITKAHFDANVGGGFSLDGSRSSAFMPRSLEWGDVIDTGSYEVYRNDVLIATVSHSINDYLDSEITSGDLTYKIKAVSGSDIEQSSYTITFKSQSDSAIAGGEYGNQVDGDYTGGEISGKTIYQFGNYTPSSGTHNIVNDKETFIFVDGDLTLDALSVLAFQGGGNGQGMTTISVDGNSTDISTDDGTPGAGGNGGTGENGTPNYANCYRYGAAGGAGAAAGGGGGGGGAGGNSGSYASSVAICPTTGGVGSGTNGGTGGAGAGRTTLANQYGGPGGNGGNAGVNTDFQHTVNFIVSGDVNLPTGSQINGNGLSGAAGSNGSEGGVTSNYQGGTGGGGGGAGGTDGVKVKIFHAGTATNNATVIVNGGAGGAGGTSSAGASGGGAGTAGSAGGNGSAGSLELIQL